MEVKFDLKEIGRRLKKLRDRESLIQEDLGRKLGCSRVAIGYYERGERVLPLDILVGYMNYFNVSADYILTGKEAQDLDKFISKIRFLCDTFQCNR